MVRGVEDVAKDIKSGRLSERLIDKEVRIIYDFTTKVLKEFGTFIKTVALYGSFVRHQMEMGSDVDVLVIVDDASVHLTPTLMNAYEVELAKILRNEGSQLTLHVNTLTLSDFWDGVRMGDPIIINILRDAVPIADAGFIAPVKLLLQKGKIRPTEEAIDFTMSRAYLHMVNYNRALLDGANELYWAVIDAGHAALMKKGIVPGSPRAVAQMLEKEFPKQLTKDDIVLVNSLYTMMKDITHGKIITVNGDDLDKLDNKVLKLMEKMKKIVVK